MNELKQLNRDAIHEKLKTVHKIVDNYVANDLIDAISTHKERDKRMINNWEDDEVFIQKTVRGTSMRLVRLFTLKGIARYLREGKVYSYENLCDYFNVQAIDKELEQFKKELETIKNDDTYHTNKILKWLFESRVQAKALGAYTTKEKLSKWLNDCPRDTSSINKKKLQLLDIEIEGFEESEEEGEDEFEIEV